MAVWPDPVRRARRRPLAARALLVGVPVAYLAVLLVAPVAAVVRGAFADGPAAFARALVTPGAARAIGLRAALCLGAVACHAVFGLALGWVLARDRAGAGRVLDSLVDLPFALSPVMVGLAILLLFGRGGWFAPAAARLGVEVVFAWPSMLLATALVSLPFVAREVAPVLEEVGAAEEEAARTLGAGRLQTFVRVVLPNVKWGLLYGLTLTAARALGEFGAVAVVSGGIEGRTETATLWIWHALEERRETDAHAMAVVLAAASVGLLLAMEWLRRRRDAATRRPAVAAGAGRSAGGAP